MFVFSNQKAFAKLVIASGVLLTSISVFANDGPGSVGGGDAIVSSTGDVENAIFKAVPLLIRFITVDLKSGEPSTILAISEKIKTQIDLKTRFKEGSAFTLQTEGGCKDEANDLHAGGATIGDTKTPFCLSRTELRKVPVTSLVEQVGALMAHELAHQVGYDEDKARWFQTVILRFYKYEAGRERFLTSLSLSEHAIDASLKLFSRHANPALICNQVGEASAFIYSSRTAELGITPVTYGDAMSTNRYDLILSTQKFLSEKDFNAYCKDTENTASREQSVRALKGMLKLINDTKKWL